MEIQSNLPLTETTLFVLLSLAPRQKHGCAIMKEVESLSDGRGAGMNRLVALVWTRN